MSYELQIDNGQGGEFRSLIGGEYALDSLETTFTIADGVESGDIYRFRYRSLNVNGWSPFSEITYIQAASNPQRPPAPQFKDATGDSISLFLFETTQNGGAEVTGYELFRNEGGVSTNYIKITTYDGSSLDHTMTVDDDSLVASTIYKFKYRAVNDYGESDFSDEVDAGVSSFPAKPDPVTKVVNESGETYITLQWDVSPDTELPVIGYILNADDGFGIEFEVVYNGINFPNVRKYMVTKLLTGQTYGFTIQAVNFNGPSEKSDVASFILCKIPTQFASPKMTAVTKTEMTLGWNAPLRDGGCPVLSFFLFRDDGAGGDLVEINADDINDLPALRSYTVSFDGADTSKTFVYRLEVSNKVGRAVTEEVSFVLAATPD